MMNYLIVDGYNIIGASAELQKLQKKDMGQARDRLLELMAEYQSYRGCHVIVIFDAYYVKGLKSTQKTNNIEIVYTKENETADECIERLVTKYKNVQNQVYVATSDYMEQRIIFGRGALRKSARELLIELKNIASEIEEDVRLHKREQPQRKILFNQDVLDQFEKWRRGDK